ncbi:nuclear transcription factor Y subunit alpha [Aplysia californica]|uniref:Nuclear transcription factor Y subunit alpha n=1 Tax=Aplysia californica TaxID=6500 RepID=A0ABM1VUX3_APLCA|nr:nuclear transcription factor Y subunit alpha [Aplysia californica]
MKRARRGKTYVELCVFAGCCLLVFVSVAQILVFSHRTRSSTGPAGMVSSLASATSADGKTSTSNVNKNNNNNANNNNKNSNNNANNNNNNNANTNKELPRRMHLVSGMQARIRARTKVQQEVRELERSLAKLMRENSITPDEANAQFRSELYARRVGGIIQMAQENGVFPHKVNGSRLRHRGKSLRPSSPSAGSMRTDNASGDPESDGGDAYSLFGDSPAGVAGGGNENEVPSYNANVGGGNGGGNKTLVAGTELGQQRASKEQNDVIKKRKSRPAPYRFRDLDESEEYELKAVVSNASAAKMEDFYREENERMQAAKRAQAEGTELFVDEEALRKESGTDLRVCPRVPESLGKLG